MRIGLSRILIGILLSAICATAHAQPSEGNSISIGAEFSPDPMSFAGTAGGPTDASIHGATPVGACVGWIPTSPQLRLTLTEQFEYLRLEISSSDDPTLVVEGPVGWWCNDDSNELDPALFGQWAPGDYNVYVGTYNFGASFPYSMTLSTDPLGVASSEPIYTTPPTTPPTYVPPTYVPPTTTPPTYVPPTYVPPTYVPPSTTPPTYVPPTYVPPSTTPPTYVPPSTTGAPPLNMTSTVPNFGSVSLSSGFYPDPQSLPGTSGGTVSAEAMGWTGTGPCAGLIAQNPDHIMTLNSYFDYLRVDVSSGGDTTLVIHGPDGWWCNDDTVGLNPRIEGQWLAGTYRVWVGSYWSGEYHAYSISFSEYR